MIAHKHFAEQGVLHASDKREALRMQVTAVAANGERWWREGQGQAEFRHLVPPDPWHTEAGGNDESSVTASE